MLTTEKPILNVKNYIVEKEHADSTFNKAGVEIFHVLLSKLKIYENALHAVYGKTNFHSIRTKIMILATHVVCKQWKQFDTEFEKLKMNIASETIVYGQENNDITYLPVDIFRNLKILKSTLEV